MPVGDTARANRYPWRSTDTRAYERPNFLTRAVVVAGRPWDLRPTDSSSLQGRDAIGVLVPYGQKVLQVVVRQLFKCFEGMIQGGLHSYL